MPDTPDTITIVCTRSAQNQTITVTIPEAMVHMLDWIAANAKNPDGTQKYLYGLNVLWQDTMSLLLPAWQEYYTAGQVAPLQQQIDAARAQITQMVQAGVSGLTVVGP